MLKRREVKWAMLEEIPYCEDMWNFYESCKNIVNETWSSFCCRQDVNSMLIF